MNMMATRIDDVENLANNLGFPRVLNRKGKRIGIGQEMPSVTILVQSELNEESLYRLLSAMVHDYLWALQQKSYHQVNNDNYRFINGSDSNLKIHASEKYLDFNLIVFLCHKAVINFAKPVWCQCQLFGWEQEHLKVLFANAFNSLGIRDDNKFWKSSNIKTG